MICKRCGIEKAQACFTKQKEMKSGRRNTCKSCTNFKSTMVRHNIDEDFLNHLHTHENCMCCRIKFKNSRDRCIHHTDTGVHGVVCQKCNRSLFQETDEDFNRIESAIIYMQSKRKLICRISELPKQNQPPGKQVTKCNETDIGAKQCIACKNYYTVDSFGNCKIRENKLCFECCRAGHQLRRSKHVKEAKQNTTHCACCSTQLKEKFIHHVGDEAYGIICLQCNMLLGDELKEQLTKLLYCRDWINQSRLQEA